jgi:DNA helicase-2/ATP-dependent DNA helicase PcrA
LPRRIGNVIEFGMEHKQNTASDLSAVGAILEGLNPAQRHAVAYGLGEKGTPPPLLIAAGAGTGKTKTLAHRVARLILGGVDPHRLLLLTFTRCAALEMTCRAQQILAASRSGVTICADATLLPWSGTFHSIGNRLLRQYAAALALNSAFTVLDRADSADLMDVVRGELALLGPARDFRKRAPVWRFIRTPSTPAAPSRRRWPISIHGVMDGKPN